MAGKIPKINSILTSSDFYSLSSCRDLCFHTQEHRFTIKQLKETLQSNELVFLGFALPQPLKALYKQCFPEDKLQINLQNWEKFEEKYPTTFAGMYQFWVSKTVNWQFSMSRIFNLSVSNTLSYCFSTKICHSWIKQK